MGRGTGARAVTVAGVALLANACGLALGIRDTTVGEVADAAEGSTSTDGSVVDAPETSTEAGVATPCPPVDDPNALFVDAATGDDTAGDGHARPFRSITKALAVAHADTIAGERIVCVRGGSTASPNVHSAATTGEVFPLTFATAGITLRGEGADRVAIAFPEAKTAPANVPSIPQGPSVAMVHVTDAGHTTRIEGVSFVVAAGGGILANASEVAIADCRFSVDATAGGDVGYFVTAYRSTSIVRTHFRGVAGNASAVLGSFDPAQLTLEDDRIEGCDRGVRTDYATVARVRRTTFAQCSFGIEHVGPGILETEANTFDNASTAAIRLGGGNVGDGDPTTFTSAGDTFVNSQIGIEVSVAAASGSLVKITDARVRAGKGDGIVVSSTIPTTVRGSSFESNTGAAVALRQGGSATALDLGAGDAGNVFQSTSKPNGTGICHQITGTLAARGNGFKACPVTTGTTCSGQIDVGVTGGGSVDAAGCVVAP